MLSKAASAGHRLFTLDHEALLLETGDMTLQQGVRNVKLSY